MNRFILSLILATLCSIYTFAQDISPVEALFSTSNINLKKQKTNLIRTGETPLWSYDFEEEGATLTEGNDTIVGKTHWQIVSLSTFPTSGISALADPQTGSAYFQPFIWRGDTLSDTPDHWAMLNLLGTHAQFGGTGQVNEGAWVEFHMDLSAAEHPKIRFNQIYRPLNRVKAYVLVSVDNGATWTEHLVNDMVKSNNYGPFEKDVLIFEAAHQSNVTVRFKMTAEATAVYGYGWQIDDIRVIDTPAYDLTLQNARVSMFGYVDYRDADILAHVWPDASVSTAAQQQGMTNDEFRRQRAYQLNDPMAQSPRQQWFTANGIAAFNVEVINNGYETVTPKANVKITDPDGAVVFDKTVPAYKALVVEDGDTIDFGTIDEENLDNSTIFFFNTDDINTIKLGRYDVMFNLFTDGHEDADTADNWEKQYFYITDNNFAMTYDAPRRYFRYDAYQSSASGDEYGTEFTYYYNPDDVMTTDVFIDSTTTVGTAIQVKLYEKNVETENWVERRHSDILTITETHLGKWVTLDFTEEYNIPAINDENRYATALVAVKGTWGTDQEVCIGSDNVLTCYGHNSKGCMRSSSNPDTWHYGFEQLAIRFHAKTGRYNITAESADETRGTVTGGGTYYDGETATLTATANDGYWFVAWTDGNTDNPRTVTVTGDATYTATFIAFHTITVTSADETLGTASGSGDYAEGLEIEISATPAEHYHFAQWNDGNTDNPRTIIVTEDATYTASFAIDRFTVTVESADAEMGIVSESGTYDYGTEIQISATPADGYGFVAWNDGNTDNPRTVIVTENITYTATFGTLRTITVLSADETMGTVEGTGEYVEGATIQITAIPNEHYHFVHWIDEENQTRDFNTDNPRTITVTGNMTYTAVFAIDQHTITVESADIAMGTVSEGGTYDYGTEIQISATAAEHYHFVQWNDGNTDNPRTITVTEDATYRAEFAIDRFTITVESADEAMGIVSESNTYDYGTEIQISATASEHYHFVSWNDGNTDNPRTITVTGDATYTASFAIDRFTITVESADEAMGTVSEGGTYDYGTEIQISASARDGYQFVSWSDGNTDNPRTITVTGDVTYTASFNSLTGIEENVALEINVFPNPATDILNISSSETISEIEIVNTLGQVVKRIEVNADNAVCDVEELKAGVYVVRIRTLSGVEGSATFSQQKFIKE